MGKVKETMDEPYQFSQKLKLRKQDVEYVDKFHQRVMEAADVLKQGHQDLMGNLCFLSGVMLGLLSRAYDFPKKEQETAGAKSRHE